MASTIIEPAEARVASSPRSTGRRTSIALVAALVVALVASALAYRSAVRTEREETFRSLYQAEGLKLGQLLSQQSQLPVAERSTLALSEAVSISAPGVRRASSLDFGVSSSDLSGDRLWAVLDASSVVAGDPWWVGDTSQRVSVLIHYRSTTVGDSNAVEAGGCVLEAVGVDWAAESCTAEQLREFGLA